MSSTIADRISQVSLVILEVTVLALYLVFQFVDLSFLDLYQALVGLVFFWLVVLLLIASLRMFSKHRLLAIAGLGVVAVIVVPLLFSIPSLRRR
jgi:hypothetical protein